MKKPARLNELMQSLFSGLPLEKRLEEGKIWLVWDATVGDRIAARARPISFRNGMLTVAVATAPWMQQLSFLKAAIIQKINKSLGVDLVTDIQLKAGSIYDNQESPKERQRKQRQLCDQEKLHIAQHASAISDPELREAMATLLGKHLANTGV